MQKIHCYVLYIFHLAHCQVAPQAAGTNEIFMWLVLTLATKHFYRGWIWPLLAGFSVPSGLPGKWAPQHTIYSKSGDHATGGPVQWFVLRDLFLYLFIYLFFTDWLSISVTGWRGKKLQLCCQKSLTWKWHIQKWPPLYRKSLLTWKEELLEGASQETFSTLLRGLERGWLIMLHSLHTNCNFLLCAILSL